MTTDDTTALAAALEAAHARVARLTAELLAAKAGAKAAERALRRGLARPQPKAPSEPPGLFDPPAQQPTGRAVFGARVVDVPDRQGVPDPTPMQVHYPDGTSKPLLPGMMATRGGAIVPVPRWLAFDRRDGRLLGEFVLTSHATPESALASALERFGRLCPAVPPGAVVVQDAAKGPVLLRHTQTVPEEERCAPAAQACPVPEPEDHAAPPCWQHVAAECPRRIDACQHQAGRYLHGVYRGSTACFHRDDRLPDDWQPTEAQAEAWRTDGVGGEKRAQASGERAAPAAQAAWDHACRFDVTLADGQVIACGWEPDAVCGTEKGVLHLAGHAVSPSGARWTLVAEGLRLAPVESAARALAQEYADMVAREAAKPPGEGPKEPKKRRKPKAGPKADSAPAQEVAE